MAVILFINQRLDFTEILRDCPSLLLPLWQNIIVPKNKQRDRESDGRVSVYPETEKERERERTREESANDHDAHHKLVLRSDS